MQQKLFYFILISCLIFLAESYSSNSRQSDSYQAYLTVSFQNSSIFQDSSSQSSIRSNIEKVFEKEGIHITHIEKPAEYKLSINVIIGDSLKINANGIGTGDAASVTLVKKPEKIYAYKTETEIYNSVKNYIKKYL
ncbi:MAG: hypothetical protein P8Z35_05580 [Ignavibacteriaceae bacterium]|jgi:hypothetical protein